MRVVVECLGEPSSFCSTRRSWSNHSYSRCSELSNGWLQTAPARTTEVLPVRGSGIGSVTSFTAVLDCLLRVPLRASLAKRFLGKRGMHLERSFKHVLDEGRLRRATFQGTENLTKRHKIAAACFNLSLLMRTLLGVGTPKQWMAGPINLLEAVTAYLCATALRFRSLYAHSRTLILVFSSPFRIPTAP
jgi:hypothetical protein